jgi:hypothetical protein
MKISIVRSITLPVSLLAAVILTSSLQASQWGSIRGNNRSAGPSQPAPRQQPQMILQPEQRQAPPPSRPAQYVQPRPAEHPQPREAQPDQRDFHPEPSRPAEHFQPAPEQVDRARVEQADARRMDTAPERRQSYFWSDYHRDMHVDRLPYGYRRIGVRGHFYFYFGGVFYDNGPSGYVVVTPPMDAEIPELPPGAETVVVGNTVFYYVAGAFYLQQPDGGFTVVGAPMGAVVSMLSPDASEVDVNGTGYYLANGVYYLPVMQNGVTAYAVVPQP